MIRNVQKRRSGFSLMELMIVIVILGLLASLVMPNIMGKSAEAKKKLVCVQMKGISETLKMFKLDNGMFPNSEEGLQSLMVNPDEEKYPSYSTSGYFDGKKLPQDSWNNGFIYINDEEEDEFDIISLGADRREGGKDDKADIKFSQCKF
jgi:general secretion pathway protein G